MKLNKDEIAVLEEGLAHYNYYLTNIMFDKEKANEEQEKVREVRKHLKELEKECENESN